MERTHLADRLSQIEALAAPVAEALGYELYDVAYVTEYGQQVLRLFIDKANIGVSLDDCEKFSMAVEPVLDKHDPIADAYVLAVSSPGVDRKLVKDAHFLRHIGADVEIKTHKPYLFQNVGQKKFRGVLRDLADGEVVLDYQGVVLRLKREDIIHCRLVYQFDKPAKKSEKTRRQKEVDNG